jgi:hypothetical protein
LIEPAEQKGGPPLGDGRRAGVAIGAQYGERLHDAEFPMAQRSVLQRRPFGEHADVPVDLR